LSVPDEISVCGFDDTTIATQVWPPLTTIHQPVHEMARRATEELLRLVLGRGEANMVELDYEMRIRASTGPRP
jgi:LacI family transcriptional regulator